MVYRFLIISSEGPWAPGPGPVEPWDRARGTMGLGPWDHGTRGPGPWDHGTGPRQYQGNI